MHESNSNDSLESPHINESSITTHNLVCNDELFYKELRAMAEDAAKGE
ncbi:hypothetical protein [Bacillus sp. 165]|nr:hypothetical protein [Bacillus sp. 165]MBO9129246.1 hypothetical protein [Bacillus sp. 165]